MSGFDNEVVYATNIDLRGISPIEGQFKENGELLIGNKTGGVGSTPTGVSNTLTEGNGITIDNGPGTIMISSTATGAWTFIVAVTASTSASVEFTDLSPNFCMFMIVLKNIAPDTDEVSLIMRTSSNNGVSYDSGASQYEWGNLVGLFQPQFQLSGEEGDTEIHITGTHLDGLIGNGANQNLSGFIYIYDPLSTEFTRLTSTGTLTSGFNDAGIAYSAGGTRLSAALVNAVQFSMSSGNIASGTFALYGLTS